MHVFGRVVSPTDLDLFLRVLSFLATMDVGEGPSRTQHAPSITREDIIKAGHTLLIKIPSGDIRSIKLEKDACGTLSRPLRCARLTFGVQDSPPWEVRVFLRK